MAVEEADTSSDEDASRTTAAKPLEWKHCDYYHGDVSSWKNAGKKQQTHKKAETKAPESPTTAEVTSGSDHTPQDQGDEPEEEDPPSPTGATASLGSPDVSLSSSSHHKSSSTKKTKRVIKARIMIRKKSTTSHEDTNASLEGGSHHGRRRSSSRVRARDGLLTEAALLSLERHSRHCGADEEDARSNRSDRSTKSELDDVQHETRSRRKSGGSTATSTSNNPKSTSATELRKLLSKEATKRRQRREAAWSDGESSCGSKTSSASRSKDPLHNLLFSSSKSKTTSHDAGLDD
eukprot:CAMPEP_0172443004 /NCGR_PEP_ID=MMETSP1065-20121228/3320_1 /TAXON_ID=265537 /ORGANISM="Amphiprora paludosa, Strain CCMP125" /LENGTH=291 /DNA_ID=CAMNT_0013193061 /DNA_START=21 /DNA_END=896 /DNA_ORIENTATION=+